MVTHRLQDDTFEFLKNDEVFIDDVEFFSILHFALEQADFLEIVELASDGIDLLAEFSREFTNEVLFFGMEKKECQKFDSGA